MLAYLAQPKQDCSLSTQLLTFENRENGANEWLQVSLSITNDATTFTGDHEIRRGWAPPQIGTEVIKRIADLMLEVIDICEGESIKASVAQKITDAATVRVVDIAKLISNY